MTIGFYARACAVSACLLTATAPAFADVLVRAVSGDLSTITDARDQFRADLGGGTTPGTNGSFGGIRREINWDGVPDTSSAPNSLSASFFNVTSPRGVVFSTPGTGFQVSADSSNADSEPVEFGGTTGQASYPSNFAPFSSERLFAARGTTVTNVNFFTAVASSTTLATVTGFGVMFSDVDILGSTTVEYFDQFNNSLGVFVAPPASGSENFSFLGVLFTGGEKIASVRITAGNAAFGELDTPTADVVVMDDFIYTEPVAQVNVGAIAVTAPNGGETVTVGTATNVTWSVSQTGGTVKIELSRNGGTTFEIVSESTADDGTESITFSGPATEQALVRVTSNIDESKTDVSDAVFTLANAASSLSDLVVTVSSVSLRRGTATARITVRNSGSVAAGASTVDTFLSSNSSVGGGDTLVSRRSIGALAAGTETAFTVRSRARRNQRFIAVADSKDAVEESNEGNNTASGRIR